MDWTDKLKVNEYMRIRQSVWRNKPENYSKCLLSCQNYKKKHRTEMNEYNKKYRESKHGKEIRLKAQTKRERNLQWIKMFPNPFSDNIKVEWHHITDVYVVAIPKELHRLCNGFFHREKVMQVVKQIYI